MNVTKDMLPSNWIKWILTCCLFLIRNPRWQWFFIFPFSKSTTFIVPVFTQITESNTNLYVFLDDQILLLLHLIVINFREKFNWCVLLSFRIDASLFPCYCTQHIVCFKLTFFFALEKFKVKQFELASESIAEEAFFKTITEQSKFVS